MAEATIRLKDRTYTRESAKSLCREDGAAYQDLLDGLPKELQRVVLKWDAKEWPKVRRAVDGCHESFVSPSSAQFWAEERRGTEMLAAYAERAVDKMFDLVEAHKGKEPKEE